MFCLLEWNDREGEGKEISMNVQSVAAGADGFVPDGGIRPGADTAVGEACLWASNDQWWFPCEVWA